MNPPTRRLGRGLSSILSMDSTAQNPASPNHLQDPANPGLLVLVPVDQLRPNPFQPRQMINPDLLNQLADSIRQTGLVQPITVRRMANGQYEIIAGERRWRAAQMAGLKEIPAFLRSATDEEVLEMALVENIFREDLSPIERALAYQRYCREFNLSAEQVASRLGEDRSTVANYIRLLDLPNDVQDMVSQGQLSMGHARCLLGLRQASEIISVAQQCVREGLSVRALEKLVRNRLEAREAAKATRATETQKRPLIRDLEQRFIRRLGCKVEILESRRKGHGRIVIRYAGLDDFDRICQCLSIDSEES